MRKRSQTWIYIVLIILGVGVFLYDYFTSQPTDTPSTSVPITATAGQAGGSGKTPAPVTITPIKDGFLPTPSMDFDFYLLSLSWSPDYCAGSGSSDTQQCSLGKRLAFVLHGLWPEYEKGYPSNCPTKYLLTNDVKQEFAGLYPSQSLYDHEWIKHGSCTGFTPRDFLAVSKAVKESVKIPDAYHAPEQPFRTTRSALVSAFLNANPAMKENSLAVFCSDNGRYLTELRVCISKTGQPTPCSAEVLKDAERSCANPDFQVRNIR